MYAEIVEAQLVIVVVVQVPDVVLSHESILSSGVDRGTNEPCAA